MAELACKPTVRRVGYQWVVTVRFRHYAEIRMLFWSWPVALQTANAYAKSGRAR